LLTNGVNSPNVLITNRLQLLIGTQLEPDKVSQSLLEKSSLDLVNLYDPTGYYQHLTFQLISIKKISAVECQIASPFY
jgi:hypothetical protein